MVIPLTATILALLATLPVAAAPPTGDSASTTYSSTLLRTLDKTDVLASVDPFEGIVADGFLKTLVPSLDDVPVNEIRDMLDGIKVSP